MFSSNNTSINSFLPPPPPAFIINHTYDHEFFLHYHDDPIITTPNLSLLTNTPFADAMAAINTNKPSLKKKMKNSKIQTSQGLRDRRVRLSIGIARKFFDLQDTLGFDKASKTLDWLFSKSKTSIMELTNSICEGEGEGGAKISLKSDSSSECEVESRANEEVVDIDGGSRTNKLRKSAFHNLSKQSRENARERARARTRAKLCTRKTLCPHTSFGIFCDKSVPQVEQLPSCYSSTNRASRADTIQESIVINTNFSAEFQIYGKPWESQFNYQSLH